MPRTAKPGAAPVVLCERSAKFEASVQQYAEALKASAADIGSHGLSQPAFDRSGIFRAAIERIRGEQSASMHEKRDFIAAVLNHLKRKRRIASWTISGGSDRHDYELRLPDGRIAVIEAKGCLDGNNTNIFQRPPHADEFYIWSLCQNPGADPRHNVWSGLNTRLSAEIIHSRQRVDGLIVWDMVCGTLGRSCPKLTADPSRATQLQGYLVPPPCLYLFPRSVPDPRSNPAPPCWKLRELPTLKALSDVFRCDANDLTLVSMEARMKGASVARSVRLERDGQEIRRSALTTIRRATT